MLVARMARSKSSARVLPPCLACAAQGQAPRHLLPHSEHTPATYALRKTTRAKDLRRTGGGASREACGARLVALLVDLVAAHGRAGARVAQVQAAARVARDQQPARAARVQPVQPAAAAAHTHRARGRALHAIMAGMGA